MPRLTESRTWNLLSGVPAKYTRLVLDALSLRQKITVTRQSLIFLRRCRQNQVIPKFIKDKHLYRTCGLPQQNKEVRRLEAQVLKLAIRSKQDHLYSMLLKCADKELKCERYLCNHLWREIVTESKRICDTIRHKTKVRLQEKYFRLTVDNQWQGVKVPGRSTSRDSISGSTVRVNDEHHKRVTAVGGVSISDDALATLELGPSFAPTQQLSYSASRKIVGSLQLLHERLRTRLKADSNGHVLHSSSGSSSIPPLPFPSSYFRAQEPNAVADIKFRMLATSILTTLRRHVNKRQISNLTAAQWRGMKEIRQQIASGAIRISVSDKGGEFVVLSQDLDKNISRSHLCDCSVYSRSTAQEFAKQYRRLYRKWDEISRAANLPRSLISRLKCESPASPVFYALIKTHKLPLGYATDSCDPSEFKVRPIISGVAGPTDRISWLLNLVLVQLFKYFPAHLPNTKAFLEKLRETRVEEGYVMESFDVSSLYTNVPRDSAVQAVFEILEEHQNDLNLYGLSIAQIVTLINECLACTTFKWCNEYYKQIRGLAMGQRLAPVLAVAFMSKVEIPVIERLPALYCRYIDDCFIVCATRTEIDICFELLNQQSEHISLTREVPSEDWLAFLNVQIHLSRGEFRTKWYRKPSNKNILVHFRSAHPTNTKHAIIRNMFRTATNVSSDCKAKAESRKLAQQIAIANGYPKTPACRRIKRSGHAVRQEDGDNRISLPIPFISDIFSAEIRACVRKADLQDLVRVVDIPPTNLKGLLVRNRLYDRSCCTPSCVVCPFGKVGDCMTSGVVYLMSCNLCGDEYVGETGRPLHVRVKEHLDGLKKSRVSTPWGDHWARKHEGLSADVAVTILAREEEITARKTLEAFWISSREPKVNRKEECIAITQELAPYADVCGFDLRDHTSLGCRQQLMPRNP